MSEEKVTLGVEEDSKRPRWQAWRMPFIVVIVIVVVFGGLMAYSRTLSHDVATWHLDPLTAPKPSTPNSYRIGPDGTESADAPAPVFDQDAATIGAAFATLTSTKNFVETVAGSEADGWITYVQRSTLFGFPDYISVRFIDLEAGGSTIAVFSRSRLGQSDLGVNEKRVIAWVAELQSSLNS